MVHAIHDLVPKIHPSVFIAWNAEVAGRVNLAKDVSIWFSVTIRADTAPIDIGEGSNIQDGSVVHVDTNAPTFIGWNVTVGHRAIIHSCMIDDGALIGMGAIILNGAEIGAESIVGAGALVTQGKKFPPRSLILGSPAKLIRELTAEEISDIRQNVEHYKELAQLAKEHYIEE